MLEISKRIVYIINNYEEMSKNSIKQCEKFNWEKIADEYIEIYQRNRN